MLKVRIVKAKYKADFKVCFVEDENRQKNAYALIGGRLTDDDNVADMSVYITDRERDADVLITRANFPIKVPLKPQM